MGKAIELVGHVDEHHRLSAQAPLNIPPGPVKLTLLMSGDTDPVDVQWMKGIADEWADELADTRQDIYTLTDGKPVDEGR